MGSCIDPTSRGMIVSTAKPSSFQFSDNQIPCASFITAAYAHERSHVTLSLKGRWIFNFPVVTYANIQELSSCETQHSFWFG